MKKFIKKYWDVIFFPAILLALFILLQIFNLGNVSIYELIGIIFAMLGITLIKREIAIGQLVSMLGQIFLVLHFLPMKLYGQVAFCIVWGIINLISFCSWNIKTNGKIIKPSDIHWIYLFLTGIGLLLIIAIQYHSGLVGLLDYSIVYLGIIGQLMLITKKIQGWILWIIVDVMSVVLFLITGSYLLFARDMFYIFNNITAYFKWKKK
jgi:nicotinamide mononucleotide transporter